MSKLLSAAPEERVPNLHPFLERLRTTQSMRDGRIVVCFPETGDQATVVVPLAQPAGCLSSH